MRPGLFFANAKILSLTSPNLLLRDLPLSPAPTPAAQLKDNPSCLLLGEALAICGSLTPDFKNLSPPDQAQCLCYSSTVWAPTLFDSAVKSCVDFASASATSAYSAIANIEGFCTNIGDVAKVPAGNTATITATVPTPLPVAACDGMTSSLSSCAKSTPGFNTMLAADQARCLCYSGTLRWTPDAFDKAADSCFEAAKNASIPAMIASSSMLEGFCSSVGDFENPSNGALAASTLPTAPSLVTSPASIITQPVSPTHAARQSPESQSAMSPAATPASMLVFTFTPPTTLAALPPIPSQTANAAPSGTPTIVSSLGDPSVQSGPSHSLSSSDSDSASGGSGSISASTASSPSTHTTPTTLRQTTASSSTTTKSSSIEVSEGSSFRSLTKTTQFEVILISGACAVVLLFLC